MSKKKKPTTTPPRPYDSTLGEHRLDRGVTMNFSAADYARLTEFAKHMRMPRARVCRELVLQHIDAWQDSAAEQIEVHDGSE